MTRFASGASGGGWSTTVAGRYSSALRGGGCSHGTPVSFHSPSPRELGKPVQTTHDRGMRGRHMTVFGFIFEPTEHSTSPKSAACPYIVELRKIATTAA